MGTTKQDVATVDEKSHAVAVYEYGDDAGAGFENTTKDDFKLPFLRVLQSNSPQVVDNNPAGVRAGLIINTVTSAFFESILFVPAITQHLYVAWRPRNAGGGGGQGFGGVYEGNDPMVQSALKALGNKFQRGEDGKILLPKTPDGEFDLVETVYWHGVQANEETGALLPAVLPMSSTGLPVSQAWMTTADGERIPGSGNRKPLFAHVYKLGSVKVEKAGNKWFNYTVSFANGSAAKSLLDPSSDLYKAAKSIRDLVLAGKVEVEHAQAGNASAEAGKADKAAENIPF